MERKEVLTEMREAFNRGLASTDPGSSAAKGFQGSIDYLDAELAPLPTETPVMADTVVRRTGLQTHLNWRDTVWGQPGWKQLFIDTGVRNTRSHMSMNAACYTDLKDIGAMLDCVIDPHDSSLNYNKTAAKAVIEKLASTCPDLVEVIEGPNEPNKNNPAGWNTKVKEYQQWLYDTIKAHPKFGKRKVVGPSIFARETAAYNLLGPVACDIGNLHYYTGGRQPPISGFPSSYDEGGDPDKTYSLDDAIREAKIIAPNKPMWNTEAGWPVQGPGLALSPWHCTDLAQAKYNIRMLCDNYVRNIWRTSIYTLIDDIVQPEPRYHGLVTQQLQKRQSYYALQRTMKLFNDPGEDFTPTDLEIRVNLPAEAARLPLMQKRDGTYLLGMWQPMAESYNRSTYVDNNIPPVQATIDLGSSRQVRIWMPTTHDDPGEEATGDSVVVNVPDHLVVLEIAA